MLWFFIFENLLFLIAISVLFRMYRREYQARRGLERKVSQDDKKSGPLINTNHRSAIRYDVVIEDCTLEISHFTDDKLNPLAGKKVQGSIGNLSLSGAKFLCDLNIPVKKIVYVVLHFHFRKESFTLQGKIVRKEELVAKDSFYYGVQFLKNSMKMEEKLGKALNQLYLERNKSV